MTSEHRTLISAPDLLTLVQQRAPLVLLDCRFDLADPSAGERAYAAGHLPGAHYLHLDRDLADAKVDAQGRFRGRHPLPPPQRFAALAGALGITPATQVVVYDAQGGMFAARAWWMLRWIGHRAVAVLDGGLPAWQAAGGPMDQAVPARVEAAAPYPASTDAMPTLDADALQQRLGAVTLIDARAPERYRGEAEPLDKQAGHIPGALNRFFQLNLQPDGRFKQPGQLRAEFVPLLGTTPPAEVVHQCGSGATACHNILAMEHAGLAGSRLYPGSWSEWSADPARPVARG
ncbi:sulfurtransferase [Ideonella sp. BN130291]|uniref:sulfurtransferase n=1 Tax=Ideonella sp. BN130291 TaxID=3112940 RepID=UPI002E254F30|nr:sulfurtransferase [Ideonella sp. BN130291]